MAPSDTTVAAVWTDSRAVFAARVNPAACGTAILLGNNCAKFGAGQLADRRPSRFLGRVLAPEHCRSVLLKGKFVTGRSRSTRKLLIQTDEVRFWRRYR